MATQTRRSCRTPISEWQQPIHTEVITETAIVTDILNQGQEWRVRFQATYWHARSVTPNVQLHPQERVQVIGRQGLVLIVQRISRRSHLASGTQQQ